MSAACTHRLDDRVAALEALFVHVAATRMAGIPILHPGLRVQAVGFEAQGDEAAATVGVLVTPWFMNLVLVPGAAESWQSVAPGLRLFRNFPSGDFAFLGSNEPEVGEFQSCSLFSPMGQFADQDGAREVALAALEALQAEPVAAAPAPGKDAFEDPKQAALERPMSKREFLGSVFRRS